MNRHEMTPAEISLAFAREVAGRDTDQECLYENGREIIDHGGIPECVCGWSGRNWDQTEHKKAIPDYANDWNATIAAVEARGWTFQVMSGRKMHRDATVRNGSGVVFYGHGELDAPRAIALCLAAIKCVREQKQ